MGTVSIICIYFFTVSWSDPLYLNVQSKATLMQAISRDATFLQTNEVMDYSMLVGQCDDKKTLYLGIIGKTKIGILPQQSQRIVSLTILFFVLTDYIRTYTFDKKIESMVKQSVLIGSQPTIVNPKQYKERFSNAMER